MVCSVLSYFTKGSSVSTCGSCLHSGVALDKDATCDSCLDSKVLNEGVLKQPTTLQHAPVMLARLSGPWVLH